MCGLVKYILFYVYNFVALDSHNVENVENPEIEKYNFTNPIQKCLNPDHKIHAWYDGSSIEIRNNLWRDKSGNNNNGMIIDNLSLIHI